MTLRHWCACLLVLTGCLLVLSGFQPDARASCVSTGEMYPAECDHAYISPPGLLERAGNIDFGCQSSWYFWCVPTEGSDCGTLQGYGDLVPGACNLAINELDNHWCADNLMPMVFNMAYKTSDCRFFEGACTCVWVFGNYPSREVDTCDCELFD